MTSSSEIIDHVVLFNIADEYSDRVDDLVNAVNSLKSLESVLYLTGGPVLRTRSTPLKINHFFHARFRSKSDLNSYFFDPAHLAVSEKQFKPIATDTVELDWAVTGLDGPEILRPGSALRFTCFKFNDGERGEKAKEEVLEGLGRIKEKLGGPWEQFSYGESFTSEERGKGYKVGALVVFPDLNELDACEEYEDEMRCLEDKVKGSLDGVLAVDYVLPRMPP